LGRAWRSIPRCWTTPHAARRGGLTGLAMVSSRSAPEGPPAHGGEWRVGAPPSPFSARVDFPPGLVEPISAARRGGGSAASTDGRQGAAPTSSGSRHSGTSQVSVLARAQPGGGGLGLVNCSIPRCSRPVGAGRPGPAWGEIPRVFTTLWQKYQAPRLSRR
jgi:hypothetical protein